MNNQDDVLSFTIYNYYIGNMFNKISESKNLQKIKDEQLELMHEKLGDNLIIAKNDTKIYELPSNTIIFNQLN